MKKTLLVLSAIATLFAFVSCGGGSTEPDGPAGSGPEGNGGDTSAVETKGFFETVEVGKIAGYGADAEIIDDDGAKVLKISARGDYESWKIVLPTTVDISGKKIKITAKFERYDTGSNTFKVAFFSDDTHGSEFDHNIAGITEFPTEYTDITVATSDLVVVWSKDDSIAVADLSAIKQINIVPQTGTGTIFIKNIEFVD